MPFEVIERGKFRCKGLSRFVWISTRGFAEAGICSGKDQSWTLV